jgi:uncharacterized membrane protein
MTKKSLVKKTGRTYTIFACLGVLLMIAGGYAKKHGFDNRFLDFGAGLGVVAAILGSVGMILFRKNPHGEFQQKIEENDERNIKIREKAAYSTFFVTLSGLSVVEIVFLYLDYMIPCFIVLGLMSIHVASYFLFMYQNDKSL